MRTPGNEFIAWQGSVGHQLAFGIDGVNVNNALCQIGTNSCNLGSKDFSFKRFQIESTTQSWHLMPSPESGKSLCMPLGTRDRTLIGLEALTTQ